VSGHLEEVEDLEARLDRTRTERDDLAANVTALEALPRPGRMRWGLHAGVMLGLVTLAWSLTPRPTGPPIVEYLARGPSVDPASLLGELTRQCLAGELARCRSVLSAYPIAEHPMAVLLREYMCDELHDEASCAGAHVP
jgi:hypothetical protein